MPAIGAKAKMGVFNFFQKFLFAIYFTIARKYYLTKKSKIFYPKVGQNQIIMLSLKYVKTTNDQNFKEFSESSGKRKNAPRLFWYVREQNGLPNDQKRKSRGNPKNGGKSLV
jgi:hypothetical protein